ncbi:MAG: hypothetical protein QOK21_3634 [Solirubrobacteraceae bacterium]|jgi:hypothetical protein|nr:hypothetical protein [Solirubrobacteraceae bacterium]
MSPNPNAAGPDPRASRDADGNYLSERTRRHYVAPRLGPSQSVRELTRAVTGSVGDGGGGGTGMMQMVGA